MIQINPYTNSRPIILTTLSLTGGKPFPLLKGLIDSGAGITAVSKRHLKNIGVDLSKPDGEKQITDASGTTQNLPFYFIDIELGDRLLIKQQFPVICSQKDYKEVDLLIGMDILEDCLVILNGKAQVYTIAT